MKDVVLAVSIFHTLSALAMFGFCVAAVVSVVQGRRSRA
jgi:hypothetical protein